jgi:hypothetical protein
MKCIHCGSDTTYPQRSSNGRRCATCLHPFAFEPKTDPYSVSDPLFQKCLSDVSAEGTLQFTARELYYELGRRLIKKSVHIPKPFGWTAAGLGAGGIIAGIAVSPVLIPVGIVGAIIAVAVGANAGKKTPRARVLTKPFVSFENDYLMPWIRTHGEPWGLIASIPSGRNATPKASPAGDPPDLGSYSFDRALIVDKAEVAAMLVYNRFHFENNCAILSLDGRFPQNGRFDQLRDMLRRNPRLIVFGIHDASAQGLTMPQRLRAPDWFPDPQVRILDLGLRPKHAIKANMLLQQQQSPAGIPAEARMGLDKEETAWLEAGYTAELEAMRPQKLMRAIYTAFNQMTTVGPDGDIIIVDSGPGIWVYDSTPGYAMDGVYGSDSFG